MSATLNTCELNRNSSIPSAIVKVNLEVHGASHTVQVPENELFRVKNIFHDNEYSILRARRHQGPLKIFDVGANIGLYAIYMNFIDPQSVIYCFEPFMGALTLLKSNVRNLCEIHLHPYGLFNKEQKALMNIHAFIPTLLIGYYLIAYRSRSLHLNTSLYFCLKHLHLLHTLVLLLHELDRLIYHLRNHDLFSLMF